MTNGMKWTVLVTVIVLTVGILIGHANNAQNEQIGKFNMECIQAGGRMDVLKDIGKVFCQKDK